MKKICYYMLILLTFAGWACKDEVPTYGPRADVLFDTDVFVDPRDGKTYHTFTVGDQTWMVENLAFRLDSGNWAGCYTYGEDILKAFTDAQIQAIYDAIPEPELFTFEEFLAEVDAAVADGRISNEKVGGATYSPAEMIGYMTGYVNSGGTTTVEQYMYGTSMYGLGFWVGIDPTLKETLMPVLEDIIKKLSGQDPFTLFLSLIDEAVADGRISDEKVPGADYSAAEMVGYMTGYVNSGKTTTIEQYMYGTSMYGLGFWVNIDPTLKETLMPVLEEIVAEVNRRIKPDPFTLFLSLIDEAVADGRISDEKVPGADYSAAEMVGYMTGYVNSGKTTTIEQYMYGTSMYGLGFWVGIDPTLNETLMPILKEIAARVEEETAEDPWPTEEAKAEALAVAVKAVQEEAFATAEAMNGRYSEKYGLLYTLDAARKAVPEGWRIPTDEDWKKLERALGMTAADCGRFEEWRGGSYVSDWFKSAESGFGLLYGGARIYGHSTGSFTVNYLNKDLNAYYLTDTQMRLNDSTYVAVIRAISVLRDGVLRGTSHMSAAHSVRLIKDTGKKNDEDDIIDGSGIVPGDALKE